MPQLDFNTTLSQIFWLIIIFFFLYIILIHFFLPNFIKLIKSRKYIILINVKETTFMKNNFYEKQLIIKNLTQKNFNKIKLALEKELFISSNLVSALDTTFTDAKITLLLYYNILYYDTIILDSISLKPNFLNLNV